MAEPQVSMESLKALAALAGLELSDERLEELAPHVRRAVEARARLERLDLKHVRPAVVFAPAGE